VRPPPLLIENRKNASPFDAVRSPPLGPIGSWGFPMVYDSNTGKAILFGNLGTGPWAYDPAANTWTNLHPGGDLPAARSGHAMVYDPVGRRMILFGGGSEGGCFNDTWAYDPVENTWTELAGSAAPSSGLFGDDTGTALDSRAQDAVDMTMRLIDEAYLQQGLKTFDPAIMTPAVLEAMSSPLNLVPAAGNDAATAPTAVAAALTVNYFGTATTYAVGGVSATGTSFGVIVDAAADHQITYYVNGKIQEQW